MITPIHSRALAAKIGLAMTWQEIEDVKTALNEYAGMRERCSEAREREDDFDHGIGEAQFELPEIVDFIETGKEPSHP